MMGVELVYPHIEKSEGHPARLKSKPRVRVAQIAMDYLAYGWSPDEMCRQHDYLTLAEAHAAMGCYFDHQEEVDSEIRSEVEQTDQTKSQSSRSPFFVRMKAKGII